MNSRVSVDAEEEGSSSSEPPKEPSPPPDSQGSVVLVLPPKEPSNDCIPVMVNGVPVYISQTDSGSPLYIRQYPPTVEEMLKRPEDGVANFDGFSDASGQTFEGFSEGSSSSVLFEGFSEAPCEIPKFSVFYSSDSYASDDDDSLLESTLPEIKSESGRRRPRARSKSKARQSRSSGTPLRKTKRVRDRSQGNESPLTTSKRRQSMERRDSQDSVELNKKPRHLPSPDSPNYIGEQCNDIGCTVSFLERMAIKEVHLCNGIVQELSDFATKIMWDKEFVVRWIQRLSGVRTEEPVEHCDLRSIQAVLKRRKALATIHSGNINVKLKMKSFDDVEFVLPSIARRKGVDHSRTAAGQSTDDETCDIAADLKPPAEIKAETDRETKEGGEEEGKARRGVKRATQDTGKRRRKGRKISKETNQDKEEETTPLQTEEEEVTEGEHREQQKLDTTEGKMSEVNNQVKEKNEEQTPGDPTKTAQERIGTKRMSTLVVKEETETQDTDKAISDRVSSTALDEQRHNNKPKSQKDKNKQDNKENEEEEEQKPINTALESPERLKTRTRRGSTAQGKQESPTADEDEQSAGETKEETDNKTKLEDKEQNKVAEEQKKESMSEDLKSTNKEVQVTGERRERRMSTRRASLLALQEERMRKETERGMRSRRRGIKQEEKEVVNEVKETDHDKQDIGKETAMKRRIRRGSVITQQEEETGRSRSRRTSLAKVNQEKEGEEAENPIDADAKELKETDKDDEQKQTTEKTGRFRRGIVNEKEDKDDSEDKIEDVSEDTQSDHDKEMENKAESCAEDDMNEEKEEPASEDKANQDTENKPSENLDSDDNEVVKRNKVINKDKRISRWQNRRMRKDDEQMSPNKEETDSEYSQLDQTTCDDTHSDDSDGNLMIDEGDSLPSDLGEGDSSMESQPPFTTPRKKVTDNEKETEGKIQQTEGSTGKEVSEGETDAHQDSGSKETSPQDTTTTPQRPQGVGSSYNGTLGVSKSGRLRKPSAKGIQSIEIKCLFMQRDSEAPRPPPPLPVLKDDRKDKDWIREKRSPMKCERREREEKRSPMKCEREREEKRSPVKWERREREEKRSPVKYERREREEKRSPVKWERRQRDSGEGRALPVKQEHKDREQERRVAVNSEPRHMECTPLEVKPRKTPNRTKKAPTEYTTYTYKEGHLVPTFKETNCYLGKYCAQAGLTVDDLNADGELDVHMTFGMIKELHEFYTTRKATKTSLAIRLFKMKGRKFVDNTHLLSTVIRLTSVAAIRPTDTQRLDREFLLPVRVGLSPGSTVDEDFSVQIKREATTPRREVLPKRVRRKRGAKPEDSGDEECYSYADEAMGDNMTREMLLTCGTKGSITRGDIVHLYTNWLRNKMLLGSNTFVTDLLQSVEKLMAERCIAPIRIPAGTLMSSSVKLHDEYKQILKISKEDAIMYLQEDWLEDITYLLSISGPSRRSTTEAEGAPASTTEESDASTAERPVKSEAVRRRHSEGPKKDMDLYEPERGKSCRKYREKASLDLPRSHQMESVGKRKRRSVRKSLDEYERDILHEIEKVGVLEEDEEDMLSQLHRDEIKDFMDDWEERDKRKKNNEKGNDRISNRDIKESSSPRKEKRPTKEGDMEIEKIVDFQEIHDSRGKKHLRYLVRWAGRDSVEDSWLDESNIAPSLVDTFWKKNKKWKPDKHKPAARKDRSPKKADTPAAVPKAREPSESRENIIQVMVRQGSANHSPNTSSGASVFTKRELLDLYDTWRQENQEKLMAGDSNTVDVEVFKNRVGCLMAVRNITFHPESLLHACFMMTLMKTRLQSKMALDKFLNTSCLEVLESSHRQYLKRNLSQVKEVPVPSTKPTKEQSATVLSLQNELHSLKLDLTSAQKWRAVKNSQLRAVEEEVSCLEAAMNIKKSEKATYLQQELGKLKNDIKMLEKCQKEGPESKDLKATEEPLFDDLANDQENYDRKSKVVRSKLTDMNISKATVNAVMDVLAQQVSNQSV